LKKLKNTQAGMRKKNTDKQGRRENQAWKRRWVKTFQGGSAGRKGSRFRSWEKVRSRRGKGNFAKSKGGGGGGQGGGGGVHVTETGWVERDKKIRRARFSWKHDSRIGKKSIRNPKKKTLSLVEKEKTRGNENGQKRLSPRGK